MDHGAVAYALDLVNY